MANSFKLVYGTNIWNHHQEPLAKELVSRLGPANFKMALFEEVDEERLRMGWQETSVYPWTIGPPKSKQDKINLFQECFGADVMIWGACPREILQQRVVAEKLTLVASERLLKKSLHRLRLLNPRYAIGFSRYRKLVNHPHIHALAIGHHAAEDLRTLGAFNGRIWNWGYFVDISGETPIPKPNHPIKILWVGRMLACKRLDTLLKAIACLRHSPYVGNCMIIGDGPDKERLKGMARRLKIDSQKVHFVPSVKSQEVRHLMRASDIYVLSSDRHEGWGAVAGEAMSEGCVLVANEQAGAAKELIVNNETGLLFRDGDYRQLAMLLEHLGREHGFRMKLRQQAWERMQTLWHPRVAAERLLKLCYGLLEGQPPFFAEGPCSNLNPF